LLHFILLIKRILTDVWHHYEWYEHVLLQVNCHSSSHTALV